MDQTVAYATEAFLRDELAKATLRSTELQQQVQNVTQRYYESSSELQKLRDDIQSWTLEALEHGTIDEETAESIAEIAEFELTKEFDVDVTVQYNVTVMAKSQEEAQAAIYDIDFDSVSYGEEITFLSATVDSIDI